MPAGSSIRPRREQLIRADLTLLAVAAIWGSAFVAQRLGNEQVGPFTFNAIRFALGGGVLLPVLALRRLRGPGKTDLHRRAGELPGGILLGVLLFGGASLQQIGLVHTTASKAGFITGLYVVIVPLLLALFWRERIRWSDWLGAGLAAVGLFLLSVMGAEGVEDAGNARVAFPLSPGDGWVLGGAFVWALHVIAIGQIAPGRDPIRLALVQYVVCAALCLLPALACERQTWDGILKAGPAIAYAGVLSTGLAYTGQVFAQRHTPAAHAAIIVSTEAVFAALFGRLLLEEALTAHQIAGCGLMLAGMVLAQGSSLASRRS